MTTLFRGGAVLVCAVSVAGCATQPATVTTAVVTPEQTNVIPADRVKDAVVVGKSTKADVIAALGDALAIRFDTGYEVWVYRLANDTRAKAASARRTASEKAGSGPSAEFVILLRPQGSWRRPEFVLRRSPSIRDEVDGRASRDRTVDLRIKRSTLTTARRY